jgi:hypothetical protein
MAARTVRHELRAPALQRRQVRDFVVRLALPAAMAAFMAGAAPREAQRERSDAELSGAW